MYCKSRLILKKTGSAKPPKLCSVGLDEDEDEGYEMRWDFAIANSVVKQGVCTCFTSNLLKYVYSSTGTLL